MALEKKHSSTTVSAREAIAEVLNTLEDQQVDPIVELCKIAKDTSNPLDMRVGIFKELASYKAPKRKAVDVNLSSEEGLTVKIIKVNTTTAAVDEMFAKKPGE